MARITFNIVNPTSGGTLRFSSDSIDRTCNTVRTFGRRRVTEVSVDGRLSAVIDNTAPLGRKEWRSDIRSLRDILETDLAATPLDAALAQESSTHTEECNEGTKGCGPDCDAVAASALFESDDPYIKAANAVVDGESDFVPAMFRF